MSQQMPPPPGGQPPYGGQPPQGGQPPYPPQGGYPGQPPASPKTKLVAGLLGIFLGGWGVHRFYLGYTNIGVWQIVVTILTDRKSTRLNSSHVAISYAVFCLKKKKTPTTKAYTN